MDSHCQKGSLTSGLLSVAFETLGRPPRLFDLKNVVKTNSATMPAVYTIGTPYTTAEKRTDGTAWNIRLYHMTRIMNTEYTNRNV